MNVAAKFLSRSDWSEVHPTWTPLGVVPDAVQHHSGGPGPNITATTLNEQVAQLIAATRSMEFSEMNRGDGLIALAYHRVVVSGGPLDGWVLESRPWNAQGGATKNHNETSKAVMIWGDFTNGLPTPAALEAAANEWANAIRGGFIANPFHGYGHKDLYPTACPGNELYTHLPTLWARVRTLLNPVATPDKVPPLYDPPINLSHVVDRLRCPAAGGWLLLEDGSVKAMFGAPDLGEPKGKKYWVGGRRAARIALRRYGILRRVGYTVIDSADEKYTFPEGK